MKLTTLAAVLGLSANTTGPAVFFRTPRSAAVVSPQARPIAKVKAKILPAVARLARVLPVKNMMSGMASWYGQAMAGRFTASGEQFDPRQLTAAHRTLPFGTMVRVTDLSNHRTVVVKVTDRGYLYPDRVIDLSYAAAEALGMVKAGVHPVALEIVAKTDVDTTAPATDDETL